MTTKEQAFPKMYRRVGAARTTPIWEIVKDLQASAEHNELLSHQIADLAEVLMQEFGGPTRDEGAVEMAIRVLREQKKEIEDLDLFQQFLLARSGTEGDEPQWMELIDKASDNETATRKRLERVTEAYSKMLPLIWAIHHAIAYDGEPKEKGTSW